MYGKFSPLTVTVNGAGESLYARVAPLRIQHTAAYKLTTYFSVE